MSFTSSLSIELFKMSGMLSVILTVVQEEVQSSLVFSQRLKRRYLEIEDVQVDFLQSLRDGPMVSPRRPSIDVDDLVSQS